MSKDAVQNERRRTVLKNTAVAASVVAGGLVASSGSAVALNTGLLCDDTDVIEIGDIDVELEDLEVLSEGENGDSELVAVEGRGEYAFVVFADDVTVEHGDVDVTIAETSISDSRTFYVDGSVDADSDVDAEQYVEFVVDGVEMIATDVLGTDVDVFLDADEEDE